MHTSVFGRFAMQGSDFGLRVTQVIAVVIILYGLQYLQATVRYAADTLAARRWEQVAAQITEVTRTGGVDESDEAIPWLVVGYRYEYQGKMYDGDRFTLAGSPLALQSLLGDRVEAISEALVKKESVPCFVDPNQPGKSALDRRFYISVLAHWSLVFGGCSLVGGVLWLTCAAELRRRKQSSKARIQHTQQPWRIRKDWSDGRIRSNSRADSWIMNAFSLTYLFVVLPLCLLVIREHGGKVVSTPGIVLIVLGWGAFNVLRTRLWSHWRYDGSVFELAGETGVIGGPLYGSIKMPGRFPDGTPLRLSIEGVQMRAVRESDNDTRIDESVIWRDSVVLQKTLRPSDDRCTLVPVYFAIPYDASPSCPDGNPSVHWFLKVGPDGRESMGEYARFEVPVFMTHQSSKTFEADPQRMHQYRVPLNLQQTIARAGCSVSRMASGSEFRFTTFRPLTFCGVIAVILVLGTLCAGLIYAQYPYWAIIPGVFAGVITLPAADMLLWKSRLRIDGNGVTALAGYSGFRSSIVSAAPASVSFKPLVLAAMRENSEYGVQLIVTLPDEPDPDASESDEPEDPEDCFTTQSMVIAKKLGSEAQAQQLADWLQQQL